MIKETIQKALYKNGIRQASLREEMLDHYLSEYETQLDLLQDEALALNETLRKIKALQGKTLNRDIFFINYKNILSMTAVFISLLITIFHFTSSENTDIYSDPPKGWPVQVALDEVSSEFGFRMHPIKKIKKMHTGIDFKANFGQEVFATGKGIVIASSHDKTHGHYIIIQHDELYKSRFNHLSERLVSKDEKVAIGTVIGKVGSSGLSTAPHLHYEILKDGKAINPREFLKV